MNDYAIRTPEPLWPTLIALGIKLGAIALNEEEGGVYATQGGAWDYIGPIYPRDPVTGEPSADPVKDAQGRTYVHANLRTPLNLKEVATELAATDPQVAAGLAAVAQFFVVDAEGNARLPNTPVRVFASGDMAIGVPDPVEEPV